MLLCTEAFLVSSGGINKFTIFIPHNLSEIYNRVTQLQPAN